MEAEDLVEAQPERRKPGRPREGFEAKRNHLIDASVHLFAEKGFHGTSIVDICEASGMSKGVVYHYISTKEEILVEIHDRFIDPLLKEADAITREKYPPDIALRMLGESLIRVMHEHLDEGFVFLNESRFVTRESPQWADIRAKQIRYESVVMDLLRAGVDQCLFRNIDIRITAMSILGMHNYAYKWYRPGGRMNPDQIAKEFGDIFLTGISASRPGGQSQ